MFIPSNMLQKYLNAQPRDMYDIVGALMGYINADPYFKTNDFDEAIKYVLSHGVTEAELYQEFDPEIEFQEDKTKWGPDYYSYARVYLKDNFCKTRIEHVKAVANEFHPVAKVSAVPSVSQSEFSDKNVEESAKTTVRTGMTSAESVKGGQQSKGKKSQDHQKNQNHMTAQNSATISGLSVCIVIFLVVVLVLMLLKHR